MFNTKIGNTRRIIQKLKRSSIQNEEEEKTEDVIWRQWHSCSSLFVLSLWYSPEEREKEEPLNSFDRLMFFSEKKKGDWLKEGEKIRGWWRRRSESRVCKKRREGIRERKREREQKERRNSHKKNIAFDFDMFCVRMSWDEYHTKAKAH